MSVPHFLKDWWQGRGDRAKHFAKWANQVATYLNLFEAAAPLTAEFTGKTIRIGIDADEGSTLVPIKITAAKGTTTAGYYDGDVYGDGTAESATLEDQLILVTGFDVDAATTQGFYFAQTRIVTIVATETTIFEVLPGYPIPPASGNYDLVSEAGVVSWKQWVDCDGNPV
ncbi:MAG: hypothetical protein HN904_03955 [Victivallales bacterium]|jgi:hypothetical protein|nr:hypothetical protein [Victivallales bacterium]